MYLYIYSGLFAYYCYTGIWYAQYLASTGDNSVAGSTVNNIFHINSTTPLVGLLNLHVSQFVLWILSVMSHERVYIQY